ncbi:uncharacterized protein PGTG_02792 [Puccinia graminis f. sp. tritici CRL 75-36-700-3]|uniref:RING-type domain-containing protein n=1 Tax=Puccinia graminis f. sp. tritici (strain CRL 75-36-700-3 / race SCCL) TaxID=418459 RepID=E3JWC6_PUCGT|nr:uncharacterized protein PGTG_02792 [Puccinia graminis f. sp. tritici CRL 75-36-700-3]EFP76351.1 hypothetical protein PGTG_02792 [Puccinia graminis f. sp. tritici CRL 75-36-700-3]
MNEALIEGTFAALYRLRRRLQLFFLDEFDGLYEIFEELRDNPHCNGLDDDRYQRFLGPVPSHIVRAFVRLDEGELSNEDAFTRDPLETPLIQIYALWRSLIRSLHTFRRATFAFLDSLIVSDATAAATSPDGEALECQICAEDIIQPGQIILQLPCHPTHLFHRECLQLISILFCCSPGLYRPTPALFAGLCLLCFLVSSPPPT